MTPIAASLKPTGCEPPDLVRRALVGGGRDGTFGLPG